MRKRRKPKNKRTTKKQKLIKVILVEGDTESNYVNYLKSLYNLNHEVKIIKRSKLAKNIKNTIENLKIQYSVSDDELILLYDLENDSTEYKKFINQDRLIHRNTYLTQPCIEYHFLLHHKEAVAATNKYRTSKETETELLNYLPRYRKGSSFIWDRSSVGINEVTLSKKRSIDTFHNYKQPSFSTIGKFVKEHFEEAKSKKTTYLKLIKIAKTYYGRLQVVSFFQFSIK